MTSYLRNWSQNFGKLKDFPYRKKIFKNSAGTRREISENQKFEKATSLRHEDRVLATSLRHEDRVLSVLPKIYLPHLDFYLFLNKKRKITHTV